MTQFDGRGDAGRPFAQRLASFPGEMRRFDDRIDAGRQLAGRPKSQRGRDIGVLGLPRGRVGTLEQVAVLVRDWFIDHLSRVAATANP